ncbi:MAG TPA: NAD(P)H-dependent oxidoreductase subunit E [Candidatus Limnocylindria bacterium]|nr:NAD(P)H-dependent oxidoreductase subunit E [Candidatus Limnocylindria bacterium]
MSGGPRSDSPLPAALLDRIDSLAAKYPTMRAALLPALWLVQDERGWISRADVAEVADRLGLAAADAEGVLSFYFLFHRAPRGTVVIDVCDNVVCRANGAERLLADLCARLGITPGETTADGRFTVRRQECIAACHQAPAVQVDLQYRGPITSVDELLGMEAR